MKKLIYVLTGLVFLTSCATTKVEESSKNESGKIKNIAQLAEIKQAVEMRRFIIKFDRLYNSRGGMIDLIPKSNYIILDGNKVIISAAYIGRQYGFRQIVGIDMIGQAVSFEMKDNSSKGRYEIRMKVKNDTNSFDVFLTISDDGYCDTSLTNYKIDHVRYTGNFIPLKPKEEKIDPEKVVI
jgi:Domain of unknown function (DUF4251)